MRLEQAANLIGKEVLERGYLVAFDHVAADEHVPDYFPDVEEGEPPITTVEEARTLAHKFAEKMDGKCTNVRVVDLNHRTVP